METCGARPRDRTESGSIAVRWRSMTTSDWNCAEGAGFKRRLRRFVLRSAASLATICPPQRGAPLALLRAKRLSPAVTGGLQTVACDDLSSAARRSACAAAREALESRRDRRASSVACELCAILTRDAAPGAAARDRHSGGARSARPRGRRPSQLRQGRAGSARARTALGAPNGSFIPGSTTTRCCRTSSSATWRCPNRTSASAWALAVTRSRPATC